MKIYGDCEEVREDFSALLDGELSADERDAMETHLSECAACLRELDGYKQVNNLYETLPAVSAPSDFEAGVKTAVAPKNVTFRRKGWGRRRLAPMLAAAAMVLVTATLATVWLNQDVTNIANETFEMASVRDASDDVDEEAPVVADRISRLRAINEAAVMQDVATSSAAAADAPPSESLIDGLIEEAKEVAFRLDLGESELAEVVEGLVAGQSKGLAEGLKEQITDVFVDEVQELLPELELGDSVIAEKAEDFFADQKKDESSSLGKQVTGFAAEALMDDDESLDRNEALTVAGDVARRVAEFRQVAAADVPSSPHENSVSLERRRTSEPLSTTDFGEADKAGAEVASAEASLDSTRAVSPREARAIRSQARRNDAQKENLGRGNSKDRNQRVARAAKPKTSGAGSSYMFIPAAGGAQTIYPLENGRFVQDGYAGQPLTPVKPRSPAWRKLLRQCLKYKVCETWAASAIVECSGIWYEIQIEKKR